MKLINTSGRARVIYGPIEMQRLEAGEERDITEAELDELKRHPNIRNWMHKGLLTVDMGAAKKPLPTAREERSGPELPEGVTGEGTETVHHGGGWYSVFHDGMPCTDEKVRKDRADEIAADYA